MVDTAVEPATEQHDPVEARSWARRLPAVLGLLAAVALVVGTVGPPLFGRGVLLATDALSSAYPWRAFDDPVAENYAHHGEVGDTIDGYFPARTLFADGLRNGDLVEWNPYPVGGTNLSADGSNATLSPFELPFVLLPDWYAPAALKVLVMAVAAGFTFLFCRRLGVGRLAAGFGGLAFAGSGFLVMWTNWPHPEVAACIPALFWATERFLQTPSARTAPPIALALAVMLLGNFPAVVLHALYVLVPYVLVRVAVEYREQLRGALGRLVGSGAAVVTGVLLVAGVLLPFADRLDYIGTDERYQTPQSVIGVEGLITTVAPKALGLSTEGPGATYYGRHVQVETIAFVGITTVLLAIAALALPRLTAVRPGARAVFGVATVVLGWAMFVGGDVLELLQHLPGFEESFVGRARAVAGFTTAVLAALGLQAVAERRWPHGRVQWAWAGAVLAVAAGVAVSGARRTLDAARAAERTDALQRSLVVPLLVGLAAVAALLLVRFANRRVAVVAAAVIPLLLVVESLALSLPLLPNEDRDTVYAKTPGIEFLVDNQGHDRIAPQDLTLYGNAASRFGLRTVTGHAFQAPTWKQAVRTADPEAFSRSHTFSFLRGEADVVTSPVLDRLGARWFAATPGALPIGDRPTTAAIDTACDHTVTLDDELAVTVPADDGLRGLVVRVCSPVELPEDAGIEVAVEGAQPARFPLAESLGPVELAMAVPGDDLDGTQAEVELSLADAGDAALTLAATPEGDLVADPVHPADDGLRVAYADDLVVYERTAALPRIRWADTATVVTDPAERLELLASGELPPGTVVLSDDGPTGSGRDAELDVVLDAPTSRRIDVDAEGDGYLVIADALQHGWVAEVDGEAVDLVEADHAGVAVHVPEGSHTVTLDYRPPGQSTGVAVSAASALGLAGAWAWGVRRRRTGRDDPPPPPDPD